MNNEIKEILNIIECWKNGDYVLAYSFNYDRASKQNDKLLYYITNLQHIEDLYNQLLKEYDELEQAYQALKDSKQWWNNRFNVVQREYEDYKSRIEKAVEYIEHSKFIKEQVIMKSNYDMQDFQVRKLLDILNGRSNE